MISEAIETYAKDHFDYDGHIAVFLHTSAVYLGVDDSYDMTQPSRAWQSHQAAVSQEAGYA